MWRADEGALTSSTPSLLWQSKVLYVVIMAIITVVFFASLGTLGLNVHDAEMFRDHARISQDFSFFFSDEREQATGRPVAELAKWLVFTACGADARSFHLVVVFLHATASVLLAFVLWQLGVKVIVSGATGLLFLLNASHFQAVHHISALDYPLALIWSILAGLFFLYASRLKSLIYWSGCGFCLACGLWTHMAVISMIPLFATARGSLVNV
jgi:hypothetical protein